MSATTPFQKILIYILIALFVSIVALSVILAATGSLSRLKEKAEPRNVSSAFGDSSDTDNYAAKYDFSVFDGIGTMRLSTCDEEPVPIVLSVYFYYPTEDSLYYEELCTKTRSLKAIIASYFAGQTMAQLQKRGESTVKAQIRNLLNKELVLGKIEELFFGEYLFF